RVTGVSDEADHFSCLDPVRVKDGRSIAREVRVVELVGRVVAYPEPPAADLLPADAVDGPVGDGDDRGAELGKEIVAVVPLAGDVASRGAVRVAVARGADDGKDVGAATERRGDLERLRQTMPTLLVTVKRGRHALSQRRLRQARTTRNRARRSGPWTGCRSRRRRGRRRRRGLGGRRRRRLRARRRRCRRRGRRWVGGGSRRLVG